MTSGVKVRVQVFDSVELARDSTRELLTISTISGTVGTLPANLSSMIGTYASDYANLNNDFNLIQAQLNSILTKLTT
jgi:hypothetical protein